MTKRDSYWFRPARFWNWFAAYYPVSVEGWVVTLLSLAALALDFIHADAHSHSVSDTLINTAPGTIAIFLVFDITCRWKGEYPSWWKRKERKPRKR